MLTRSSGSPEERSRTRSIAFGASLFASLALSLVGASGVRADSTTTIAAGNGYTCAIGAGGAALCWGANHYGRLGDGTNTSSDVPVVVSGLGSDVAAVAAATTHACALTTGGGVLCWGRNASGELGDGTTTDSNVPVGVSGLGSGVAAIGTGTSHSCALTTGGSVLCWGSNAFGQLGDGTTTDSHVPVGVSGLGSGVAAVSVGDNHTCAVTTGGGALCWGINGQGRLGDGTTTESHVPVGVSGLGSGVASVSAGGYHTCAVTTGGGALCWGSNGYGRLGNGGSMDSYVPAGVSGLGSGVADVSAGFDQTCARTTAGAALCWGHNGSGQLGDGTTTDSNVPVGVSGLGSGVAAVTTGDYHSCARTTGGGALCWGTNPEGQLGDGTSEQSGTPVAVTSLGSGASAITAGDAHTCALTTGNEPLCWGYNFNGRLGDGTTIDRSTPVAVSGLGSGAGAIAGGGKHSCALTPGGGAVCWGLNSSGQLGDGTTTSSSVPVDVSGLGSGVAAIALGGSHTCALTTGGGVLCWGSGSYGQLGDGSTTGSSVPVAVSGLGSGVAAITAGTSHSCALTTGGGVLCWGINGQGELGDGTSSSSSVPVAVSGLGSGVAAITAGGYHSCALTTGGGALCWGRGSDGELGNGSSLTKYVPTPVSGLASGVDALAAGSYHSCALTTGGGALCWGRGSDGQLGDGALSSSNVPVAVSGLASGAAALAAGGAHTCALTAIGGVVCWGDDNSGQLGDGHYEINPTPVSVIGFAMTVPALAGPALALLAAAIGLAGRQPARLCRSRQRRS